MQKQIVFVEASSTGAGEVANKLAKARGLTVTLVTQRKLSYAQELMAYVDNVIECDTNSAEVTTQQILSWDLQCPVHAVTTTADFYVPQAARAAEALSLPGLSYTAALGVRNKYTMRLRLERLWPKFNPRFGIAYGIDEALKTASEWGFPVIAKPQDGNDSLNVRLIQTTDELVAYVQRAEEWRLNSAGQPFARGILLESYIDGEEFGVETEQYAGEAIRLIGVHKKQLAGCERGHFVELGTKFARSMPESDLLFSEVALALQALDVSCGVIHTECRIEHGQVKILEINPRLVGDMVGSHVIEVALGYNPIESVISTALAERSDWESRFARGAAIFGVPMPRPGIFLGILNVEEIARMPGVRYIQQMGKVGEFYSLPESNGDVLAWVIAEGDDATEAMTRAVNGASKANVAVN